MTVITLLGGGLIAEKFHVLEFGETRDLAPASATSHGAHRPGNSSRLNVPKLVPDSSASLWTKLSWSGGQSAP